MAASPGPPATYDERLSVPLWWWPVGALLAAFLGAQLFAGFGWMGALVTYSTLTVLLVAALVWLGRVRVSVTDEELRAGAVRVPLDDVVEARALEPGALRDRMSRNADARALLVTRPWVKTAVEITARPGAGPPYWLVSTRGPDVVAMLVRQACGAPSQHGSM